MMEMSVATENIHVIWQWGIDLIRSIQGLGSPFMTFIMLAISELGDKTAYIAILPFLFWCLDEKNTIKLSVAFILSNWINSTVKEFFAHPRPYDFAPELGLARETSYGFPSGHTQNSTVFWGIIFSWTKRRAIRTICIILPLLIAFSRIYLGVHFPTDLLAGWILAALVLLVFYLAGNQLEDLVVKFDFRIRILITVILAVLMNAALPHDPSMGGLFFGMGAGYVLMREFVNFKAASRGTERIPRIFILALRWVLGIAVTALIYLGLVAVFPGAQSDWYSLGRFLRYAAVGAWVCLGAPWLFCRIKLA